MSRYNEEPAAKKPKDWSRTQDYKNLKYFVHM